MGDLDPYPTIKIVVVPDGSAPPIEKTKPAEPFSVLRWIAANDIAEANTEAKRQYFLKYHRFIPSFSGPRIICESPHTPCRFGCGIQRQGDSWEPRF